MGKSLVLIALSCLLAAGCSVGMAMSGKKEPQLGAVRVGATRGEIELQLGAPVEIREEGGGRLDVYEYEMGNEPSAGRAIGHGVLDVLTLGLWEIAGTPIEGIQGDKKRLIITYDDNDVATKIGTIAPPRKGSPRQEKKETDAATAPLSSRDDKRHPNGFMSAVLRTSLDFVNTGRQYVENTSTADEL